MRSQPQLLRFNPNHYGPGPHGGQFAPAAEGGGTATQHSERIAANLISGFTRHGLNQTINRGVSPGGMLDAVNRPLQILPRPNGTVRYVGHNATVVLNPDGSVVTAW